MRALALLAVIAAQTGALAAQTPAAQTLAAQTRAAQTPEPQQPPVAQPQYLHYQRPITLPARTGPSRAGTAQACAILDAGVFPHAAPSLRDLRIFPIPSGSAQRDVPYVITLSQTATEDTEPAHPINLGKLPNGRIAFDLPMPPRPYSGVRLDIAAQNFLATATVSGETEPTAAPARRTALGAFTLFDLTAQHLSRDTTLPLTESTFPYLHVELNFTPAPGTPKPATPFGPAVVQAAEVPPSRLAQTLYSPVAETRTLTTSGRETRATLDVPARVPIERISLELPPGYTSNFSRDVRITATPEPDTASSPNPGPTAAERITSASDLRRGTLPTETLTGSILRVHSTVAGRQISTEQLGIPAVLGANLQSPARIEVTLENGDDRPLPIAAVRLEMRQRKLCFDTPEPPQGAESTGTPGPTTPGPTLALFYGDPALQAPVYDYQRLFHPSPAALSATLGPELPNPDYRPRPTAPRSFTERHPEVLWIALIAVICALGMVALNSARRVGTPHP